MPRRLDQPRRGPTAILATLICLCLSACASSDISVTEVMNHSLCNNLTSGVQRIAFEDLASVRGARLLAPPSEPVVPVESAQDVLLVAVFNGEQPTPGYGFELQEAFVEADHVVLNYRWHAPSPGAVMAQMVTSPCSVIQINDAEGITSVSALIDGVELGRLTLSV